MSDQPGPRDRDTIIAVLNLRRNAVVGFTVGLLIAAGAYAYRVGELGGPALDVRGSPFLFLLLAFVLAVTTGLLITAVLTIWTVLKLVQD